MRPPLQLLALVAAALAGCPRAVGPAREQVKVLVIAPHPDDEVLMAGGVLERAVREGRRAAVIVVTSGGLGCERNGPAREAETVAALSSLGLDEQDVHFLGYPDGYLSKLGDSPLPPVEQIDAQGRCVPTAITSASHGSRHLDEHSARVGQGAPFTAQALEGDLTALLSRLQPTELYLPHPIDAHDDHAATYTFVRRALAPLRVAPSLHRAVVHAGRCWPGDCQRPYQPDQPVPALPEPLAAYTPRERLAANAERKLQQISRYRSQAGPEPTSNWLSAFARPEETFYPEALARDERWGWLRPPAPGSAPSQLELSFAAGAVVALVADGERVEFELDPEAVTLRRGTATVHRWPRPAGDFPGLHLRVDPRPDDGGVSEWSLWGPDGFFGQAVVFPAHRTVQCAAEQAVGACIVSTSVAVTGINRGVTR